MPEITPRLTPFRWFGNQAEEAAYFSVSIFGNSRIRGIARYGAAGAAAARRPFRPR
jgi:predicted 3-demethylubiquinone-9 3-methyltransferase (glyoxalase superfamily)